MVHPVATTSMLHTNMFSFRDIEESLNSFSGEDAYTVRKWITDFDRSSIAFKWSELQRFVYGQKLLKGTAKRFFRTVDVSTWEELKIHLCEEFERTVCGADVHKKLSETKKSSTASFHDYLLRMCEVRKAHRIDDESMIKHIINGIPDEMTNKQMLFGATTLKEYTVKYFASANAK